MDHLVYQENLQLI